MQSLVTTEAVLKYVSRQAEPINLLQFPSLRFWLYNSRYTDQLVEEIYKLAEDYGTPIEYIKGKFYIRFFDELKLIHDDEMEQFFADCMEGFGIARYDQPSLFECLN